MSQASLHEVATPAEVHWSGIRTYLIICFGFTWILEITALTRGVRFSVLTPATTVLLAGVMLIPAASAYVVRRWITREGFSSAGLRFGSWKPYLCVWLGVPCLFLAIYAVTCFCGFGSFSASTASVVKALPPLPPGTHLPATSLLLALVVISSLTTGPLITSLFTFGEEFGWTGYLLPSLLPLGRLKATLLYGAIWGLWHAPIVIGGFNYPGHPVAGVFAMCGFTIALGLIQCFLFTTFRSVLLTSFFHAAINTQALGVWHLVVTHVEPLRGGLLGIAGIAILAGVGTFLWFADLGSSEVSRARFIRSPE